MKQTAEALIDETGQVRLLEPLKVQGVCRALVIVLDEIKGAETVVLAEKSLEDWLRPEEDEAWSHLQ
ncbi:MAG: hypothetical protein ACK4JF_09635, partial [Methylohalobius sp.]